MYYGDVSFSTLVDHSRIHRKIISGELAPIEVVGMNLEKLLRDYGKNCVRLMTTVHT